MPPCAREKKKHHGNDQSSQATHRAANYPTEMRTVFDCMFFFFFYMIQTVSSLELPGRINHDLTEGNKPPEEL